jgi:hypothetical protein
MLTNRDARLERAALNFDEGKILDTAARITVSGVSQQ